MASKYLNHQGIAISEGQIKDVTHINKFGSTSGTITTLSTIWDAESTTAIYPYPATGLVTIAGATNTDDDGEIVVVQGLGADYGLQTEEIPVAGSGALQFSRIFRAFMKSTGNSQDINILQGGSLAARIISGAGQTQMAVYTVPAGFTGYLVKIHGSSDRNQGTTATQFILKAREEGSAVFRTKGTYGTAGGDQFDYEYPVPLRFESKTDIRVDAVATQGTKVSAIFDIILVATGR